MDVFVVSLTCFKLCLYDMRVLQNHSNTTILLKQYSLYQNYDSNFIYLTANPHTLCSVLTNSGMLDEI